MIGGPGTIEYRCRRCGKLDRAVHTPDTLISVVELVNHERVKSFDGVPVHMRSIHSCPDGGSGIGDAIGGITDERLQEAPPLLADGWALLSWRRDPSESVHIMCIASSEARRIEWWWRDNKGDWVLAEMMPDYGNLPDRTKGPPLLREPS